MVVFEDAPLTLGSTSPGFGSRRFDTDAMGISDLAKSDNDSSCIVGHDSPHCWCIRGHHAPLWLPYSKGQMIRHVPVMLQWWVTHTV